MIQALDTYSDSYYNILTTMARRLLDINIKNVSSRIYKEMYFKVVNGQTVRHIILLPTPKGPQPSVLSIHFKIRGGGAVPL